jgi:hypothetical protein
MSSPAEFRHLPYKEISFCMPVLKKFAAFDPRHDLTPSLNNVEAL